MDQPTHHTSRSAGAPVAVITGAASGIGRALAIQLAADGHDLAISDIDEVGLAATRDEAARAGVQVLASHLDVADRAAVLAHAAQVEAHFGTVDLVVANAGIAAVGSVRSQRYEHLRRVIEVDFLGVVHTCEAFLPRLVAGGGGRLATVSSCFGLLAVPGNSAYNAAKFAVRGYTEALRQEVLLTGVPVEVSCVHPGGVRTAIARNALLADDHNREELVRLFDRLALTSPEAAARVILRGVGRGRARVLVGADAWAFDLVARVLGARYTDLVGRSGAIRRALGSLSARRATGDDNRQVVAARHRLAATDDGAARSTS